MLFQAGDIARLFIHDCIIPSSRSVHRGHAMRRSVRTRCFMQVVSEQKQSRLETERPRLEEENWIGQGQR